MGHLPWNNMTTVPGHSLALGCVCESKQRWSQVSATFTADQKLALPTARVWASRPLSCTAGKSFLFLCKSGTHGGRGWADPLPSPTPMCLAQPVHMPIDAAWEAQAGGRNETAPEGQVTRRPRCCTCEASSVGRCRRSQPEPHGKQPCMCIDGPMVSERCQLTREAQHRGGVTI